jgi:replication initiation and membrane attachment protein DnaB
MSNESELLEKFHAQIEAELQLCDGEITPLICYNFNDMSLRKSLIETIAETCLSQKITIAQAIVQVDKLYSANSID